MKVFYLSHDDARKGCARYVMEAPAGWRVEFKEPNRKVEQSDKFHAMIGDIAKHCTFMGNHLDAEDWKRLLIDAYVRIKRDEAHAAGKPDPFHDQGRVLPSLDGTGFVQLGVQSRGFSKALASEFIEYLYAYGSEQRVAWSESSKSVYEMQRRAA